GRQQRESVRIQSLVLLIAHEQVVEALEPDRAEVADARYVIGGVVDARISEDEESARGRAVDEARRRLEHEHARRLRSDERTGDVKTVLGQQLVEVVAGDAARDFRKARANQIGVLIANLSQSRVDLA